MHILIADDEPTSRLLVAAAVQRLGHRATIVEDGADAWARFVDLAPDVVITDWDMPGMDGTELTSRIRGRHDVPYPYIMSSPAAPTRSPRARRWRPAPTT